MSKLPTNKASPPAKKATTTATTNESKVNKAAVPADSVPTAAPVTAKWSGYLRVGSVVDEIPDVKTIRLLPESGEGLLPFTFVPGQFINVAFFIGGARMIRSYSISSSPTHREYLDLTVRREPRGAVSRHMVDLLRVGELVEAGGPVGKFTFNGSESDNIVLISAGVGVTPMLSITRYLTEQAWDGEIFYIFSFSYPSEYMFAEELASLQKQNPQLHVAVTVTRPKGTDWTGHKGRISKEFLSQSVPNLTSRRMPPVAATPPNKNFRRCSKSLMVFA